MRLILVLLVLLFTFSFVYAGDVTTSCKQLCADKKTCCSAPLNNEFYLKSTLECSSCENQKYFAESENFGIGSTITICSLNKDEYEVQKGKSDGRYSDVSSAVSSLTSSVSSAVSSLASSIIGGSGGFDNSYTGDDSGAAIKFNKNYKGGEGKLNKQDRENNYIIKKQHTSHAATLALEAVANSVASAMASTIDSSANPTFVKGESLFENKYKGGEGKFINQKVSKITNLSIQPKKIIGKCIKVSTVGLGSNEQKLDKPIINVSKQVCKDLLGESCESTDQHKIISVVQSTKNDGFSNEDAFEVDREEYNLIIKHGQILRNQCGLKGKCQFNRT